MKKYILFVLLFVFILPSCMDEEPLQPNTNKGNFEALWKIIDNQYCYLDYKNINWDSIHSVYNIKITDLEVIGSLI